ncbi:MAG TPA: thioredoxin [Gaiellaceae bacterium]|nr:thioredoxin [Gaiellaceae bacterium]
MREIDAASWDDAVLGAERPIIVDFWAPWCRPCRAIRPILEELEAETGGRVGFAGVDIDNYPEIAARYDVLSIPTVILFSGGEPQETLVGARPRGHFVKAFGPWLGLSESGPS